MCCGAARGRKPTRLSLSAPPPQVAQPGGSAEGSTGGATAAALPTCNLGHDQLPSRTSWRQQLIHLSSPSRSLPSPPPRAARPRPPGCRATLPPGCVPACSAGQREGTLSRFVAHHGRRQPPLGQLASSSRARRTHQQELQEQQARSYAEPPP